MKSACGQKYSKMEWLSETAETMNFLGSLFPIGKKEKTLPLEGAVRREK
jgi:hypothetical protein